MASRVPSKDRISPMDAPLPSFAPRTCVAPALFEGGRALFSLIHERGTQHYAETEYGVEFHIGIELVTAG